jgi:hypothetical protein
LIPTSSSSSSSSKPWLQMVVFTSSTVCAVLQYAACVQLNRAGLLKKGSQKQASCQLWRNKLRFVLLAKHLVSRPYNCAAHCAQCTACMRSLA